jgi:hypothetical protein
MCIFTRNRNRFIMNNIKKLGSLMIVSLTLIGCYLVAHNVYMVTQTYRLHHDIQVTYCIRLHSELCSAENMVINGDSFLELSETMGTNFVRCGNYANRCQSKPKRYYDTFSDFYIHPVLNVGMLFHTIYLYLVDCDQFKTAKRDYTTRGYDVKSFWTDEVANSCNSVSVFGSMLTSNAMSFVWTLLILVIVLYCMIKPLVGYLRAGLGCPKHNQCEATPRLSHQIHGCQYCYNV